MTTQTLTTTLVTARHKYDDLDVIGHASVKRICVPHSIKKGEACNVYCADGSKHGALWQGGVEQTLQEFALPLVDHA